MARLTALEKQQVLVDLANGLFTRTIIGHTDNGDGTITFQTNTDHNFVVGDFVVLYDVISDDNEITTFSDYASSLLEFEVSVITPDTFTITLAYNASVVLTNLKARSVFTFNNDQIDIKSKEYPVLFIECKDTNRLLNAANIFIPQETEFVLTNLDKLTHHTKGRNTKVKECRKFNEVKMNLILGEFGKRVISDKMGRGEFDWIDEPVSYVDVKIEY